MPRAIAGMWLVALLVVAACACEKKSPSGASPADTVAVGAQPAPKSASASAKHALVDASIVEKVEVPEVRVRKDATTTVRVTWATPKGTAVNDEAPFRLRWSRSEGLIDAPSDVRSTGSDVKGGFRVKVHPMVDAPNATLGGEIDIVVCDAATHAVCVPVRRKVELGFVIVKDAPDETTVAIPLPEARVN